MPDFMAEHRRQFRFIVHQREQLARHVNIAARDRHRVVHR